MSVTRNVLIGLIAAGAATLAMAAGTSTGESSREKSFEHEGRLLDNGLPVNALVDLEFGVFDAVTGGVRVGPALFAEEVPVEDGYYFVTLEFGEFEFNAARHWLEMSVNGLTLPRQRLVRTVDLNQNVTGVETAGAADENAEPGTANDASRRSGRIAARIDSNHAGGSQDLAGFEGDPDGDPDENPFSADTNDEPGGEDGGNGIWDTRGSEYYYDKANVGIGTTNPAYPLDVRNSSRSRTLSVDNTDGSGVRYGVYSRATSTTGRGVYGYASATSGSAFGIYGRANSSEGVGVYGVATSPTGSNVGVWGEISNPGGYAGRFTGSFRVDLFSGAESFEVFEPNGNLFFELDGAGTGVGIFNNAGNHIFNLDASAEQFEIHEADGSRFFGLDAPQQRLAMNNGDGTELFSVDTTDDALVQVRGADGNVGVEIYGDYGTGSLINMYADSGGPRTITIDGQTATAAYIDIDGDLIANIKNAVVQMDNGEERLFYCTESPEVWFEDVGSSRLIGGEARVDLDALFLQTVTIDEQNPLRVLITLTDDCNGVFVRKYDDHFVVKELNGGVSNATFDYKIICKREGYESRRLEPYLRRSEDGRGDRAPTEAGRN